MNTPKPNFGKVEYLCPSDPLFVCFARRGTQGLVARMRFAPSGLRDRSRGMLLGRVTGLVSRSGITYKRQQRETAT
jgi:hypothetical protein